MIHQESNLLGPAAFREPAADPRILVGLLVVVATSAFLALEAIHGNFVMVDEYAHVPAGMSYWQRGQFDLYRENPPLIQCLVALPGLVAGAQVDYTHAGGYRREWQVGQDFLIANSAREHDIFRQARCIVLCLGIATGVLIYWWASAVYGAMAGVVCAALWLFDPSVLAFSGICTGDIGSALFGLLATYTFWRYLRCPNRLRMIAAGVGLGLALGSKFNLMMIYPGWVAAALVAQARGFSGQPRPDRLRLSAELVSLGLLGLLTLNSLYCFEGSLTPLDTFDFRSRILSGSAETSMREPHAGNRFRGTILAGMPVPLPRNFLLGLDSQRWEAEVGLEDLQQGQLTRGGRWYGPLVTLGTKLPLGTLVLLLWGTVWALRARRISLSGLLLWLPGCLLLVTLCLQTGLNWPIRYTLSALPFSFIAIGGSIAASLRHRVGRWLVVICLASNLIEVGRIRPYFLSYANQLTGGSAAAQRRFHGSNYDWGQDLYRAKEWHDQHPNLRPITYSYYGATPASYVGLPMLAFPVSVFSDQGVTPASATPPPGAKPDSRSGAFYWAISSNFLNGMTENFMSEDGLVHSGRLRSPHLRRENAIARIGTTIYVFRIGDPDPATPGLPSVPLRDLSRSIQILDATDGIDASP